MTFDFDFATDYEIKSKDRKGWKGRSYEFIYMYIVFDDPFYEYNSRVQYMIYQYEFNSNSGYTNCFCSENFKCNDWLGSGLYPICVMSDLNPKSAYIKNVWLCPR